MQTIEHTIPKPFNLVNSIKSHGWFQLIPYYWDEATQSLTWAMRTATGAAIAVSVSETGTKKDQVTLEFRLHDSAMAEPKEIIQHFHYLMNLDLDLTGFYQLCATHPVISVVPKRGMGRMLRSASVFEDVFKSICGTNVQWRQAVKMINAIAGIGTMVPGTDLRIFPTPGQILEAGESFLKDVGRVGYRSSYLVDLCERALKPDKMGERIEKERAPYKELFDYFTGFKGIGKVTARYLCALYGRFDELSIDSLVISYMSKIYFNGEKPTVKQIEDIFNQYGEWQYLVYWTEFIVNKGWDPDA